MESFSYIQFLNSALFSGRILGEEFLIFIGRFQSLFTGLIFRTDIDLIAGQFRGEFSILTLVADREGELVIGDDNTAGLFGAGQNLDLGDNRRGEGFFNKGCIVVGIADDIDLFAVQLFDDGSNTAALRADTCADRVDIGVLLMTAILVREPASREMARTSTVPS